MRKAIWLLVLTDIVVISTVLFLTVPLGTGRTAKAQDRDSHLTKPRASYTNCYYCDYLTEYATAPYNCGSCTWWAWLNRQDLPSDLGNAGEWDDNARGRWPVDTTPRVGDVVVFDPGVQDAGGWGHVAYVIEVSSPTSYRVSEMNWAGHWCQVTIRTPPPPEPGVWFIHRKETSSPILNFTAELYGAPSNRQSAAVEIEVREVGSTTHLFKQTAGTDSNGQCRGVALSGVQPGLYDLYAKPIAPSGYLRKKAGYVTLSSGTNTVDFSKGGASKFAPGDIDKYGQDNLVNILDFSMFLDYYATDNLLADFNRDGEANILDFSVFLDVYGQNGDGEVGAYGHSGNQLAPVQSSTSDAYVALIPYGGTTWNVGEIFNPDIVVDTGDYATDGTDLIVLYDPCILEVQDEDPAKEGIQIKEGTSHSPGKMYSSYPTNHVDTSLGKIYLRGTIDVGSQPVTTGYGEFGSIRFKAQCGIDRTPVSIEYVPQFSADTNVGGSESKRDVLAGVNSFDYRINGDPACLIGDFDCSCEVDIADVMEVASRWRMTAMDVGWHPRYDLDRDGNIDIVDIMKVVANWGKSCQ